MAISQPGDAFEQEADRVAEAVVSGSFASSNMQGAAPPVQRKCGCGGSSPGACEECQQREEEMPAGPVIQRHAAGESGGAVHNGVAGNNVPPVVHEALRSSGSPLDTSVRPMMESRFGRDFGDVRVHTDSVAAKSAQAVNALAYTAGNDVVFAPGQYQPHSLEGERLLAHELTHTLQQNSGAVVQRQAVPAIQRDDVHPVAATACAFAPDDYRGVGPAGPTEALQAEVVAIDAGAEPGTSFDLLDRVWMTYGQAGAQIYIYHLFKRMWARSGPRAVDQFVDKLVYRIGLVIAGRTSSGNPRVPGFADDPHVPSFADDATVQRAWLIAGTLSAQKDRLHAESDQFITCYEAQATATAIGALDESEQRVTGELQHYFGSSLFAQFFFGPDDDMEDSRSEEEDQASRIALGIAAQGLAKRRNASLKANMAYRDSVYGNHALTLAEREPIEEEQRRAERDYELFRKQVVPRFPILEQVSAPEIDWRDEDSELDDDTGEGLNTLAQLAQGGDSEDTTHFIIGQIADKLKNIAKIREELKPGGEVNVWQVPRIVDATSELTGAMPGTFYGKLIEDKVNEEPPRSLTSRLVDIVEIALYVAAPFTEGISLIPATMITASRAGYRVYEHWKEYETGKALHGTDFGGAALSGEDPSLFWLGADIAGAFVEVGLSVVPAAEVFRELAPAARAARAMAGAEGVAALETAAEELTTRELGPEKAAQFASKIAEDARAAQAGAIPGMTAGEAKMLEQADAQAAEAAAKRTGAKGIPATSAKAGGRFPVGAAMPDQADRVLGVVIDSKLAGVGATDTLESARTAMRAGDTAEAERLFAQLQEHLTVDEANLLWRDLGRLAESATRLEEPITLLGKRHLLKMVQGEDGAFFVLCSWCTRVRDILRSALEKARQEGAAAAVRVSRLETMIQQVEQMEANFAVGKVGKAEATSTNTMRALLGKLTEGEHLIGSELRALPARSIPNFTRLARDPAVASRAADLYEGYLEQLWEARRDVFGGGKQVREQLWKELEKEAEARALTQAQRESARGVPLELAPGAPARAVVNPSADFPFGFYDRSGFEEFSHRLNATLKGAPDARLIVEGSAVSGRRFERIVAPFGPTGTPFGLGRLSDFDIAIISDSLFAKAEHLRIIGKGKLATAPLSSVELSRLGLADLDAAAREAVLDATGIAYPVHFSIRPASAPAKLGLPLSGGGM